MYELKIVTHFAAAHQLKMVTKKCEKLHGHNWKIEVCVAGTSLNAMGVLIDFGELKTYVSEILAKIDHQFLNDLSFFQNINPSSENIAYYIATELQKSIDNDFLKVVSVTAWETENACATYKC